MLPEFVLLSVVSLQIRKVVVLESSSVKGYVLIVLVERICDLSSSIVKE